MPCTISRRALSALYTVGLPTRLFGVPFWFDPVETVMSVIDQALKANELYAKTYDPKCGAAFKRYLVVQASESPGTPAQD